MKTFLNIIWHFPFFGFLFALSYALVGLLFCITVVGLPIGLGLLQFSKFLLWPQGNKMVNKADLHELKGTEQNPLWKTFALIVRILYFPFGLLGAISCIITIVCEFISIIGIPCGLVWAKSLGTIFNPVNKVCVPEYVALEIEKKKQERDLANRGINTTPAREEVIEKPEVRAVEEETIVPVSEEQPADENVAGVPGQISEIITAVAAKVASDEEKVEIPLPEEEEDIPQAETNDTYLVEVATEKISDSAANVIEPEPIITEPIAPSSDKQTQKVTPGAEVKPERKKQTVLLIALAVVLIGGGATYAILANKSDDATEQMVSVSEDNEPMITAEEANNASEPFVEEILEEKIEPAIGEVTEQPAKKEPEKVTAVAKAEEKSQVNTPKEVPAKEPEVIAPVPAPRIEAHPRYGTKNYPTGTVYTGNFNAAGLRHGKGTYQWPNGDKYEGDWVNDNATGQGTYYSREGWRYVGQFVNLKFHGKGVYYFANGKSRKGTWVNGEMQK
ncbi:uncharacterized membrane protein YccF (DUF307 family) [Dysgonomonas sp. PH5-45]|uniref:YccF domain-containing protein n=1 Tax=unclassified Dysgonomonas TaxID=2630389 RepID=UPI0024762FBC|nr:MULTISPECIES: YccF domain-containing protein [unclassified Dysgonomonas]MDH6355498.1 uncharacterized membrane protein YccF (DUF307 family) [Dysgonomonas sp. PH5-45]MDH6388394.1 uncharacterized membrane protein YccF (DUF307 family) [Dysgonomonas sp. PH5-37]